MARVGDQPEVAVTVSTSASPAQLWPLICDIDLPARFSDEFQGATWLDAGAPFLGARFEGRNEHAAIGAWSVTCTVDRYTEGRCFGWAVGNAEDPVARWAFTIEESSAGSELVFSAQLGLAPSGLTPMIEASPEHEEAIVGMRLEMWRANMEATAKGIAALAEAS